MAKATMKLSDGTIVNIEGTPEEIKKILSAHMPTATESLPKHKLEAKPSHIKPVAKSSGEPDLLALVEKTKSCDETEEIEKNILDRSSQIDKILLPLYVSHKYFANAYGLTSGDIVKYLNQFGLTLFQSNIANTLKTTASKYIMPDKISRKGEHCRYKISRRGVQYLSSVIKPKANA